MNLASPTTIRSSQLPLRMRKGKLTAEVEQVVVILTTEYGMQRDDAIRLVVETGPLMVFALRARKKV